MSAKAFAQRVIEKMEAAIGKDGGGFSDSSADDANIAIAEAVTEYLLDNTFIPIVYSGMIGIIPDPIVADIIGVTGECEPPDTSASLDLWLISLATNICAGFKTGDGLIGVSPIAAVPVWTLPATLTTEVTQDDLTQIQVDMEEGDDLQLLVWTEICGGIISWLNSQPPGVSYGAQNTTGSVGTATTTVTLVT